MVFKSNYLAVYFEVIVIKSMHVWQIIYKSKGKK